MKTKFKEVATQSQMVCGICFKPIVQNPHECKDQPTKLKLTVKQP